MGLFNRILTLITFVFFISPIKLYANAYTPATPDAIIARWPKLDEPKQRALEQQLKLNSTQDSAHTPPSSDSLKAAAADNTARQLALAQAYLSQAAMPGQARFYGLAQAILAPLMAVPTDNIELLLTWAQVQQHEHQFSQAQTAIQTILEKDPNNTTAILLQARLFLIQDNPKAARSTCLRLLGRGDLFTVTTCSLEAGSYFGPHELSESFQQLQQLTKQGLPEDARGTWLAQILADMALRLNQPQIAVDYLQPNLANATVSLWSQWADAMLALHQPQAVLATMGPIVSGQSDIDDALCLRLALAEKQVNSSANFWREQIAERISLREARADTQHAADLAIYYLDLQPNAQKALAWAQTNWQQAREPADKNLLARAHLAANVTTGN